MSEDTRPGENPMQPKVDGYRKLTDHELRVVNKAKTAGPGLQELLDEAEKTVAAREADSGIRDNEARRALAIAKTDIQTGFMWLIRAVAAPNGLT